MLFTFQQIVNALNAQLPHSDNFAFRMARAEVIPADYILNSVLPQENRPDYHVDGASMRIYPTMLGQVAQDSPYPPMGAMSSSEFFSKTTKLGGTMFFPEEAQRQLQSWEKNIAALGFNDGLSSAQLAGALSLNADGRPDMNTINGRRLNAVLGIGNSIQKAIWDTNEWMRGRAIFTGEIDWTFNDIQLRIDYKIPAGNIFTNRTGNDAYGGSSSKFWVDMRKIHTKVSNPVIMMNSKTWYSIIDNPVNNVQVLVADGINRVITRIDGTKLTQNIDVRDRVRIVVYDGSGTVIDAKTGALSAVSFVPDGRIAVVGERKPDGFLLAQGSVANPDDTLRLGYTHVAPTVEGGGRPGAWARVYTPEGKPMQVLAETAINVLPAILNPDRLLLLQTEIV